MAKKIVLISCASKKLAYKSKAEDLYISPLFKYSLAYARKLNPDAIYILFAKHDLKKDMFIFLAGNNDRNYILPYIKNCELPLKGLGIGQKLAFLKNEINN